MIDVFAGVVLAGESAGHLALIVALIVALGVVAQILGDRYRVPSVLFLIFAGILVGPEGIGNWVTFIDPIVTQDTFGGALSTIVGLSVAVIVFEGAFHLKISKLREAPSANVKLVTLGAAVSFIGTTVAVRYLLGTEWAIAGVIGALLVATGPTVITPILEVVAVRDRVEAALETEGIVNDVTAAILAVVIFEVLQIEEASVQIYIEEFSRRLGTGVVIGLVVAGIVWYVLRHIDLSPDNAPQNARLLTLAGAVVAFATANEIASEAGVAAVATAGIVLGNADLPYEEQIEEFKGDVTLIVLSFVFIALAALLEFDKLLGLGWQGIALVLVVALVLRPLLVFASTTGGQFTWSERWFISLVGPRGIIPASVATLFALELQSTNPGGADTLVGAVFLVILLTVVFEAGLARQIAEALDVIPMRVLIIGGGQVGRSLADRLDDRGENVVIIEQNPEIVELAREAGFTVHKGDGTDTDVLRAAGADNAKIVVAATGDDDANLLVAQLANSKFSVDTVIARANNSDNVEAFEDLGVRTISSAMATAWAIDNEIERPALSDWITHFGEEGDIQEITVTSDELVGRTLSEIGPELPPGCLVALVSRDGEVQVPGADFTLQEGDNLTLLGERDSVREAMSFCHPED
ncbi:cation:proton antiporter domain-containing protein [Haloarchaeobius baliensis]|uniref:cation:proton antiporter domain-containing protein n=1 Tax=Haloarchaeobius baliensis TaxID=1670458 RepID=UPI003F885EA4